MPSPRATSLLAVLLALAATTWPAWAAPAAIEPPPTPSFLGELLAILVPLVLIIIALFLVLRLARRRYGLTGQDAPLSILQILPVGPRERVVVIRARSGRVFTIGVGAQSVTFITELDALDLTRPETPVSVAVPEDSDTAVSR